MGDGCFGHFAPLWGDGQSLRPSPRSVKENFCQEKNMRNNWISLRPSLPGGVIYFQRTSHSPTKGRVTSLEMKYGTKPYQFISVESFGEE